MFNQALDTPWKVWNELLRWLDIPYVRLLFASNRITWGKDWRFYGIPTLQKHRYSFMNFGAHLQLRSSVSSNPLGPNHPVMLVTWQKGASLEVGANFSMTGGTLCAAEKIQIGNKVAVGANTTIVDTDFHPLDPEERWVNPMEAKSAPVIIEDNVFIGMNCLVLKGVRIGTGSVIGAGSVVTRDVPAKVIAAGNPAQPIRQL